MNLTQASKLLVESHRSELVDHAFGDAEVYWEDDKGREIAEGYFGRNSQGVDFVDGGSFSSNDAMTLRDLGILVASKRNDSLDDLNHHC